MKKWLKRLACAPFLFFTILLMASPYGAVLALQDVYEVDEMVLTVLGFGFLTAFVGWCMIFDAISDRRR